MIKNILKLSFRYLFRRKLNSLLNIVGLSIGLTCCILIFLYLSWELSFDKYQSKKDRIHRVVVQSQFPSGISYDASTPYPLAEALKTDYPELDQVCGIYLEADGIITIEERKFPEQSILYTEPQLFEIFDYEWISGNPIEALNNPGSVVLTESLAKKYFAEEDPFGKSIKLDNFHDLTITGILKDPPKNSHLQFCMVIPMETLSEKTIGLEYNRWTITLTGMYCYVLLPEKYPPSQLEDQFPDFTKKHLPEKDAETDEFHLQALGDFHYNTDFGPYNYSYVTSKKNLVIFSVIGLLILIIACINFINMTTAQAIKRSKEVGIKKTLGSSRGKLFRQFMSETYVVSFISLIFSLILAEIFLPYLNDFLGYDINMKLYGSLAIIIFLFLIFLVIGFLSGFYPSMIISSFNPTSALSKKIELSQGKKISLRSALVIFQFIISQILIISTIIISLQVKYFQDKDLGFSSKDIIRIEFPDIEDAKLRTLQSKLEQFPTIEEFSFAIGAPTADSNLGTHFNEPGSEDEYRVSFKPVDQNYLQTFKLDLLAGEWLPEYNAEDTVYHYVVNEALIKNINCQEPIEAIGKEIIVSNMRGDITGVVKNFNMSSLRNKIGNVVLTHFPRFYAGACLKIDPNNKDAAINTLKTTWEEVFPESFFEYEYIDDYLDELYEDENRIFSIIRVFSIIAILISCLGLFGLVSYITAQRTKEVGIRKAIGASFGNIVLLLSTDFSKLVLLANIISWPVAWYIVDKWLQNFAFPIDMPWLVFPFTAIVSLIIALLTVSYQAIRTANSNPVKALRYE